MSKFLLNLPKEYTNAYNLNLKKQYSKPKIYNANNDLKRRWYVYFSFRNPATDKLVRQTPIYAGVNLHKTLKERKQAIHILLKAVESILEDGHNPYDDVKPLDQAKSYTIEDAVTYALKIKENSLRETSYNDFKIRVKDFEKWLLTNGFKNRLINSINKKVVLDFLNMKLSKTSASNRNNSRSVLSSFFQTLDDNDIIDTNFVKKISVLNSTPKRNKTYTSKQEEDIIEYLKEHDKLCLLFIQFISYNHLRPIEVARLKIKDIDIKDKLIYVKAKNKAVKMKILPEILLNELPSLEGFEPDTYLFTPKGIGFDWKTTESSRRAYFGERFRVVKDKLNLGEEYGLYSFRHTFITKLYKQLVKDSTPFEAKSKLMLITGHTTMTALEKYLRDIDAVLPDDYSDLIK